MDIRKERLVEKSEEIETNSTSKESKSDLNMDIRKEKLVEKSEEIKTNSTFKGSKSDLNLPSTSSDDLVNQWIDILGNKELRKKVIQRGVEGSRPETGEKCTLRIVGKLKDGTIVEEYDNLTIELGDKEVIQGLELTIALMDVNEIAEIEVYPRFAYGELGREPDIPPDAVINYIVELKTVELVDMEKLNMKQRQEIGYKKRERGNWWYNRKEWMIAVHCYRRALQYISPTDSSWCTIKTEETLTDRELQSLLEDRTKIYTNLAAAQMELKNYETALEYVNNALNTHPNNAKALFKKGKILHELGENMPAYITLLQAVKLEPNIKNIKDELIAVKIALARTKQIEKEMFRKMLSDYQSDSNLPKDTKNTKDTKDTKENKNRNIRSVLWSIVGASVVGMSVLVYRLVS